MNAEAKIASGAPAPLSREAADPRPRSAVSPAVGLVGLMGLVAWVSVARVYGMDGPLAALTGLLACGIPMLAWSLLVDKVHRSPTTGIDWATPPRPLREIADISLAKIAGLWATWAVIGFVYCIARFYWDGQYLFAMQVLGAAVVPMLVLSVPYVLWLDRRLVEPRDGAWQFGQLLVGRAERVDWPVLHDYWRSWAIKGFFLAFMISIVPGNFALAVNAEAGWVVAHPANLAIWLIWVMFMIDVTFATVGYVLTLKPLDAHIRSANPYAAGWMAALICYPPFIMMNGGGPLDYVTGTAGHDAWLHWLDGSPLLLSLWGLGLAALAGIYAWATVVFGFRFSNLTHRGIITHGPYAWTKHPAYVSKNLFWWLAVLPFMPADGNIVDAIRNAALLLLVNAVYYWRARTEEKHLSADPAYRAYAEWMDRHGPIPRLVNRLRPAGWSRPAPLPAE
jgi:protein-S-isoprenylcysteine O-methyltransferase Ste14